MKIALLGSPQSGKTELRPTFHSLGFEFINLNNTGNELRALGSQQRPAFDQLVPGLLYDDGRRMDPYYAAMMSDPELFGKLMALEMPAVQEECFRLTGMPGNRVVSWEYMQRLLPLYRPDHVLFLRTSSEVWFERLRVRAMARDWQGPPPTNDMLRAVMRSIHCSPEQIEGELAEEGVDYTVIDTSSDDWGEAELRATFQRMGW